MSRVFVVQEPARREAGRWLPKFDLSPAEAFGELVLMLPHGNVPMDPGPTRAILRKALRDFAFGSDHLLLLGDPVACAHAIVALSQRIQYLQGLGHNYPMSISCLKWDRRAGQYSPYLV